MTTPKSVRRISIRSVRKDPIDYKKLGRALIALAMAQAEADAQSEEEEKHEKADESTPRPEEAE